jgi:hypothetical protein
MSATTVDRDTPTRSGDQVSHPLAAATKIPAGVMVQINAAGNAVNASATIANKMVGVSEELVDNSGGAAGDKSITPRRRIAARFANSASGDLIARADIGGTAYVVDNQTVAKTDDTGARPAAGKIIDVDAQGVWVEFT